MSRPCSRAAWSRREGGLGSWLPASPIAWPPGTAETPSPKPPWTNIQSFPRTGHWRSRSRCEGKGQKDGKGPPSPQKILLAPSFLAACVTEVLLLVPHCPPLSLLVSLAWVLVVRRPTSWQARRQEKEEEGQGLECQDGPPEKTLRNQRVF